MNGCFGVFSLDGAPVEREVLAAMGEALRCHPRQRVSLDQDGCLGVGVLDLHPAVGSECPEVPARSGDGRYRLWLAGEVFSGPVPVASPAASRTLSFRERLLAAIVESGPELLRRLSGHFHGALFDRREQRLTLFTDRFGMLPLYRAQGRQRLAFGCGVRGLLMVPGIPAEPDLDALDEALTFGGFRIGQRTNVKGATMLPPAAVLEVSAAAGLRESRHWRYADVAPLPARPAADRIEEARARWIQAVSRCLGDGCRQGQTLSGGLDSRAILAVAAPMDPTWLAFTYGQRDSDDVRIARRAAAAAGARWMHAPLEEEGSDWLQRREDWIQPTDGLLQLVDLMHLENAGTLSQEIDVLLLGTIGDAVCGPTYARVQNVDDVLQHLPFEGGVLSWPRPRARQRMLEIMEEVRPAAPQYALYETKLAQCIHRIYQSPGAFCRARHPFLDHDLFDFYAGQPDTDRPHLYPRMLRESWPALFARIPHQKTGVPVLAPSWRVQSARALRWARRRLGRLPGTLGKRLRPGPRQYCAPDVVWKRPAIRSRIEAVILAKDSAACALYSRPRVTEMLRLFFEEGRGSAQALGALYVFEAWRAGLPSFLRAARDRVQGAAHHVPALGDGASSQPGVGH